MMPRGVAGAGRRPYTHAMFHAAQHQALQGLRRRGQLPGAGRRQPRARDLHRVQHLHYENPLNVVGTVPFWDDQVLLCRRNIEPRYGLWTLPAGFMELGETTELGRAARDREEAGARVELHGLFTLLTSCRVGQVHLFYRARLLDTDFAPGPETIEAQLFREDEVPWSEIAFRTSKRTLELFFADRPRPAHSASTLPTSPKPRPRSARADQARDVRIGGGCAQDPLVALSRPRPRSSARRATAGPRRADRMRWRAARAQLSRLSAETRTAKSVSAASSAVATAGLPFGPRPRPRSAARAARARRSQTHCGLRRTRRSLMATAASLPSRRRSRAAVTSNAFWRPSRPSPGQKLLGDRIDPQRVVAVRGQKAQQLERLSRGLAGLALGLAQRPRVGVDRDGPRL